MTGLRLMIHDRTCRGRGAVPGLSHAWWLGAQLYAGLGRFDASMGVSSWREALRFLGEVEPDRPLAEVQFWGHGKWGRALIGNDELDASALEPSHVLQPSLQRVRDRFVPDGQGLLWFRTCETAGADAGRAFVASLARFLGARVAGHTHIIGVWQSGTRSVAPGEEPTWSATEGLREGTAAAPERAYGSSPFAPSTITCLQGALPDTALG